MSKKRSEIKRITKCFRHLNVSFRKRVCKELGWDKDQFKKFIRNSQSSKREIAAMRAIGWELTTEIRRKISN